MLEVVKEDLMRAEVDSIYSFCVNNIYIYAEITSDVFLRSSRSKALTSQAFSWTLSSLSAVSFQIIFYF